MKTVKLRYVSLLQQWSHTSYKLSIPSSFGFSINIKIVMPIF